MSAGRQFPVIDDARVAPRIPISFVVVRFSDEILHNFLSSEVARGALNEIIQVDNTSNLYFENLSSAIIHGVRRASHEIIAVIHEDVRLIDGWQSRFEASLAQLERHDPRWGILGSVGFNVGQGVTGHWSDPHRYQNDFADGDADFFKINWLDEQLLVFHRSRLPIFDPDLPGIHHLGRDLSSGLGRRGFRAYVIDAPTIHKYRDARGRIVQGPADSEKINDRRSLTYKAEKACCDQYIAQKWREWSSVDRDPDDFHLPFNDADKLRQLDRPVICISRGGSGSRLLSLMARDAGVYLGGDLNASGDSMEMVPAIYRAIFEKYACNAVWQSNQRFERIRAAAARMIQDVPADRAWGFKLPESVFLLPEFERIFPNARYVHLLRDPLSTCLRRTHITARTDNHVGRLTLRLAYDHIGRPRESILTDHPAFRMAYTTIHQLDLVSVLKSKLPAGRFMEVRFEQVLEAPGEQLSSLSDWLGSDVSRDRLERSIDRKRAARSRSGFPDAIAGEVGRVLWKLRRREGYLNRLERVEEM